MSTQPRLTEIKERADKATPGPWYQFREDPRVPVMDDGKFPESLLCETADGYFAFTWAKDCEFVVAARADIPFLVQELEQALTVLNDIVAHVSLPNDGAGLTKWEREWLERSSAFLQKHGRGM